MYERGKSKPFSVISFASNEDNLLQVEGEEDLSKLIMGIWDEQEN